MNLKIVIPAFLLGLHTINFYMLRDPYNEVLQPAAALLWMFRLGIHLRFYVARHHRSIPLLFQYALSQVCYLATVLIWTTVFLFMAYGGDCIRRGIYDVGIVAAITGGFMIWIISTEKGRGLSPLYFRANPSRAAHPHILDHHIFTKNA